jgi:hypothetical protein
MTPGNRQTPSNGNSTPANIGPTSETLAKILAELRDITEKAEAADETYRPLEPNSPTYMRRGIRFAVPAQQRVWPTRLAIGGGALLLAGVLALPLSGTLFSDTAMTDVAQPQIDARASTDEASDRSVVADAADGNSGALSRQEMASLLPPPLTPSEPAITPALRRTVATSEQNPTSTASIAPQVGKPELPIARSTIELPAALLPTGPALASSPDQAEAAPVPALPPEKKPEAPVVGQTPTPGSGTRVASLTNVAIAPATPSLSASQAAVLLTRAQELVQNRDISSARLILEKALSAGSAQAAFQLAETYDPQMLAAWDVRGINGDSGRAKELYVRASEAGIAGAKDRLGGLLQ